MIDSQELTNYLLKDVVKTPSWTSLMSPKWLADNGEDSDRAIGEIKKRLELSSFEWKDLINPAVFDDDDDVEDDLDSATERFRLVLEALEAARANENWTSDDILGSVRTKWGKQKTKNLANLIKKGEHVPSPKV